MAYIVALVILLLGLVGVGFLMGQGLHYVIGTLVRIS